MRNFMDRMGKAAETASSYLLFAIAVVVALQVMFRYVFRVIAPWTEELSRYLAIWMVYAGTIVATIRSDHICVTLLVDKFSPKVKSWTEVLFIFLGLVVSIIVLLGSLHLIRNNFRQMAVTIPISVAVLYVPITIFSAISLLSLSFRLFELVKGGIRWK